MRLAILATVAFVAAPAPVIAQAPRDLLVSPSWLASRAGAPNVVVLHAETRRARYDAGHIPGARFLDLDGIAWSGPGNLGSELRTPAEIEAAFEALGVSDGLHVVIYGGDPLTAARAWMTLDVMGFNGTVSLLDGGLAGWRDAGGTLSTLTPTFGSGALSLRPRDGVLVDAEWILARLNDRSVTLIDARPEDEYTGADGGMGGRVHAGHIPGAYSLYWERLVQSRAHPTMMNLDTVRALFRASGAVEGGTVVVYCMVGLRASYSYFAARLLGYDAKFYDGSWHDWGARDLPYVSGSSRR